MKKLWYNGSIYTLRTEGEKVEGILTEGNTIIDIGRIEHLRKRWREYEEINLQGHTMLPGIVDSHLHLIGHGEQLQRLDFSSCTSIKQIFSLIKEKIKATPKGQWIIGEGWNDSLFIEKEIFTLEEIDAFSPHHPLLLKRICHHSVFVNSEALRKANLTWDTLEPKGGKIGRDSTGSLNGFLYEEAMELLTPVLPTIDKTYIQQALKTGIKSCYKNGLVGIHTEDLAYYGDDELVLECLKEVVKEMPLKMNVLVNQKASRVLKRKWDDYPYIEKGAMKLFADGSLGSYTALLSEPYADKPTTNGLAVLSREELKQAVQQARQLEMTVAIHTIGDLSLQYILEALEAYPPLVGQRDRIIHAEVVREDLIERMKVLPIVLDIQPVFISTGFQWMEKRLGKERLAYTHVWKRLLEEGIACAGGSDCPIETVNPFVGMYCAITQRNAFFAKEGILHAEQRLSRYEALKLYTYGSAYAIKKEQQRGKIEKGYEADFTIIDRDYFHCEEEDILHINVAMTVIDGQIVYEKE